MAAAVARHRGSARRCGHVFPGIAPASCRPMQHASAHLAPMSITAAGGAPDWVHLLPPGPVLKTVDGRGPFRVGSLQKIILTSMQAGNGKLPIDENHATDF